MNRKFNGILTNFFRNFLNVAQCVKLKLVIKCIIYIDDVWEHAAKVDLGK